MATTTGIPPLLFKWDFQLWYSQQWYSQQWDFQQWDFQQWVFQQCQLLTWYSCYCLLALFPLEAAHVSLVVPVSLLGTP